MDSSYVDLADPSHLEFDYMRWLRSVVLTVRARRNLHIGGGACALPRALALRDPGGLQVVCEIDAEVLALARRHLGLRRAPGLRVRHADGGQWLARQAERSFDAIIVDAFVGAALPPALFTAETLRSGARVAPFMLINIVDDRADRVVHAVAATLADVHSAVWRLTGRSANTVLLGGELGPGAAERLSARLARDPSPARLARL